MNFVKKIFFIILMIYLASSGFIATSGFAKSVSYNEITTSCIIFALLVSYINNRKIDIKNKKISLLNIFLVYLFIIVMAIYNSPTIYATNMLTILGFYGFLYLFKIIPWNIIKHEYTAHIFCIVSLSITYLFLPGKIFSGWNSNSTICTLPSLLLGSCLLVMAKDNKFQKIYIYIYILTGIYLQFQLGNRSVFLALMLFILAFTFKWYLKRSFCLALMVATLIFNFSLPLFQKVITKSELFLIFSSLLEKSFNKTALNGRDGLWSLAMIKVAESPFIGNPNSRKLYFHNFSIDVLLQFGILGLVFWMYSVYNVTNTELRNNAKENIFFASFSIIIFLNTFENALFANNYLMPLPYALLAIPLYLKQHTLSYEK